MTVGSQVKQCLASLKSIQATLESFALQSNDKEGGYELMKAAETVGIIVGDLNKRVSELEREEPQYKGF